MIRYFEVLGPFDEVEYFGFMDTGVDRVVVFDDDQFFTNYGHFEMYKNCDMWVRCESLIPVRMKT